MNNKGTILLTSWLIVLLLAGGGPFNASAPAVVSASQGKPTTTKPQTDDSDSFQSEMRALIERYVVDRGALNRTYPGSSSPARRDRMKQFYTQQLDSLNKINFEGMSLDGRVDFLLFKNHLDYELRQLDVQSKQFAEIEPLIPFSKVITELDEDPAPHATYQFSQSSGGSRAIKRDDRTDAQEGGGRHTTGNQN